MHDLVYFYPQGHQAHFERGHPERPERVEAIREALREVGWWDPYPHLEPVALSDEVLHAVHSLDYLAKLQRVCQYGQHYDMDTYTTPASWQLALNAAGGAVAVADSVWTAEARRGFALTRPPGHHATRDRAMGFCVLNNIAIAAEYLVQARAAQRIAIVDLDLHHGNGTQDIFYRRGDVFYISTHQSPLYPGTGALNETGKGAGQGANANFPLPPMAGDQAFLAVMDELILPLLDRFTPQMILVSYGFDPHRNDPLGSLLLGEDAYGQLIERLAGWADAHCEGRIALCLEGGYDLEAARLCSLAVVAALLGVERPGPATAPPPPGTQMERETWRSMLRQAKFIWNL
jgi:acetoin utilization deacetylase AcuC-like enzyme